MKLSKEFINELREMFGEDHIRVIKAIQFADKKHKGMLRDDGTPYISHPLRVAEYVRKHKQSKNATLLYMAAVLHDTMEDTYTSYRELAEEFTPETASLVMELSTPKFAPMWTEGGKAGYLAKKMCHMTNYALYIKLCDRLDNLSTLKGCTREKQKRTIDDTKYIISYLLKEKTLTPSQLAVVNEINQKINEFETVKQ